MGSDATALDRKELVAALDGVEVLVCEVERVDAAVLDASPACVDRACRADPTNVDLVAASLATSSLATPGRNAISVADFTVGLLLTHARRIGAAEDQLRERGWGIAGELPYFRYRGPELAGRTAGLVGLGAVGRLVAKRLSAFGMSIVAFDPYVGEVPHMVRCSGSTSC